MKTILLENNTQQYMTGNVQIKVFNPNVETKHYDLYFIDNDGTNKSYLSNRDIYPQNSDDRLMDVISFTGLVLNPGVNLVFESECDNLLVKVSEVQLRSYPK